MKQVDQISISELLGMATNMHGDYVKAVVDLKKDLMVVDSEMHADAEQLLLSQGSVQEDLWGINLYPENYDTANFIQFDSMINIRPRQNNRSRGVDDPKIQNRIRDLVKIKVKP